jgi:hypothetical protein
LIEEPVIDTNVQRSDELRHRELVAERAHRAVEARAKAEAEAEAERRGQLAQSPVRQQNEVTTEKTERTATFTPIPAPSLGRVQHSDDESAQLPQKQVASTSLPTQPTGRISRDLPSSQQKSISQAFKEAIPPGRQMELVGMGVTVIANLFRIAELGPWGVALAFAGAAWQTWDVMKTKLYPTSK